MAQKHWFSSLFDGLGLAALVMAIFALGGFMWFMDAAPQGTLINVFHFGLATSIVCFASARCVQIARVIRHTPSPKSQRVALEIAEDGTVADSPSDVVAGEIPRAA